MVASTSIMKGNYMENSDKTGCSDNTRYQLKRFGYNMIALALSIALYYLGFFGSVEGPLNPSTIGQYLKSFGFSGNHLLFALFILFAFSVSWNWIYNSAVKLHFYLKYTGGEKSENISAAPEPVQKGKWGHTLWAALLIFILTFVFHMYKN